MHWLLVYFYIFDVSFVLALLLTPLCKRLSYNWGFIDMPDSDRKIHTEAMPLMGGFAVAGAFVANLLFHYLIVLPVLAKVHLPLVDAPDLRVHIDGAFSVWRKLVVLLVGGVLMVALGAYDDKYDLKPRAKLLAQCVIAALVWRWRACTSRCSCTAGSRASR